MYSSYFLQKNDKEGKTISRKHLHKQLSSA